MTSCRGALPSPLELGKGFHYGRRNQNDIAQAAPLAALDWILLRVHDRRAVHRLLRGDKRMGVEITLSTEGEQSDERQCDGGAREHFAVLGRDAAWIESGDERH